jgi:hypothetical protein
VKGGKSQRLLWGDNAPKTLVFPSIGLINEVAIMRRLSNVIYTICNRWIKIYTLVPHILVPHLTILMGQAKWAYGA